MLIQDGTIILTRGDISVRAKATVSVNDRDQVEVIIEAPDEPVCPITGGTWQLVDGECEMFSVADTTDDIEFTFVASVSAPAIKHAVEASRNVVDRDYRSTL